MIGPCAKQVVTATLVTEDGQRFVGKNYCLNAQSSCPRGSTPSGEGYELCRDVCRQVGHAEEVALMHALYADNVKVSGAACYVEGHTYACSTCTDVLASYGIERIIIGAPPRA